MSKKYPNWNYGDWPWAKGSWHESSWYDKLYIYGLKEYIFIYKEQRFSWLEPQPRYFEGGIQIRDPFFVFPKSKYEGLSLSDMVGLHPKALRLHMLHNNIYIWPDIIENIPNISQFQKLKLRREVESYLTFVPISEEFPILQSFTYSSFFDGKTILEIIDIDKKYIPYLLDHAEGRLRIDIEYLYKLVEDATSDKVINVLQSCIEKMESIFEKQREAEEIYRSYLEGLAEEEELRWYENEGYQSAFDSDPDAEWNID